MDQKGILVSIDAIFGLVVLFMVLVAVAHMGSLQGSTPAQEVEASNDAQDIMELMATYESVPGQGSILAQVVGKWESSAGPYPSSSAGTVVKEFLDQNLPDKKYDFREINRMKDTPLACKGDLKSANNVNSATRSYGNYTFQLCIWR